MIMEGSVRGWSATLVRMKYCGTGGKPVGKQRKQTSSYSPGSLQPTRTGRQTRKRKVRSLCELTDILPCFPQICEMFLSHLDPFF